MKKISLIFVLLLLITAIVIADTKDYNQDKNEIIIKDNDGNDKVIYQLLENTDYCNRECYTLLNITLNEKYELFDEIKIFNSGGVESTLDNLSYEIINDKNNQNIKVKYDKETLNVGSYLLKIIGYKKPRESVDWVLNILGFDLIEWKWWNSWQDWGDDFEDSSINSTFWATDTIACSYGEPGPSTVTVTEEGSGDEYVRQRLDLPCGPGEIQAGWTGLITKQDYNDSKDYTINFTVGGTGDVFAGDTSYGGDGFVLNVVGNTNPSPNGCNNGFMTGASSVDEIYSFSDGEATGHNNYSLTIDASNNNFTLYNASDMSYLGSSTTTKAKWYLLFEYSAGGVNLGTWDNSIYIYNFTSLSDLSIATTLNSPADSSTTNNDIEYFAGTFNMSQSSHNVTNATLYIWNQSDGSLIYNITQDLGTNSSGSTTNKSYTFDNYGTYLWNYLAWGTDGTDNVSDWADSNFTITMNDTLTPNFTIISPSSSISSAGITINVSVTDKGGLDYCYYNITRGASAEKSDEAFDLSDNFLNDTYTLSGEATYSLNVWCNDTNGNGNYTNQSFTYTIPSGSGPTTGGGGSVTVIQGEGQWIMQVADGIASYEISMPDGTSRELKIQFENLGDEELEMELSCDDQLGNICKYVTFPKSPFTLPLLKDIKTKIPFVITLPDDIDPKDYQFNIIATDNHDRTGAITVYLKVGKAGLLISALSKLKKSTKNGVPYILIFFPVLIGSLILFAKIIPKKVAYKGGWVILLSSTVSILTLYFL